MVNISYNFIQGLLAKRTGLLFRKKVEPKNQYHRGNRLESNAYLERLIQFGSATY